MSPLLLVWYLVLAQGEHFLSAFSPYSFFGQAIFFLKITIFLSVCIFAVRMNSFHTNESSFNSKDYWTMEFAVLENVGFLSIGKINPSGTFFLLPERAYKFFIVKQVSLVVQLLELGRRKEWLSKVGAVILFLWSWWWSHFCGFGAWSKFQSFLEAQSGRKKLLFPFSL